MMNMDSMDDLIEIGQEEAEQPVAKFSPEVLIPAYDLLKKEELQSSSSADLDDEEEEMEMTLGESMMDNNDDGVVELPMEEEEETALTVDEFVPVDESVPVNADNEAVAKDTEETPSVATSDNSSDDASFDNDEAAPLASSSSPWCGTRRNRLFVTIASLAFVVILVLSASLGVRKYRSLDANGASGEVSSAMISTAGDGGDVAEDGGAGVETDIPTDAPTTYSPTSSAPTVSPTLPPAQSMSNDIEPEVRHNQRRRLLRGSSRQ